MNVSIQERIQEDLKTAMKNRDRKSIDVLRFIKSEFQRGDKVVEDGKAIKILKGLRKGAQEMLDILIEKDAASDDKMRTLNLFHTVESYLPKEMSQEDVNTWVTANTLTIKEKGNFGLMMKFAMSHLPKGTNGKFVTEALKKI